MLNSEQIRFYNLNGYLIVNNIISQKTIGDLKTDFQFWVNESQKHKKPFGHMVNDKPRFDIEKGHSKKHPKLRRINSPDEISKPYFKVMSDSHITDSVADLIGPNIKLHHTKINSKLPGAKTEVKWHQDFAFTPHTNDNVITALLMIDDVTNQNGPLEVLPGSHKDVLHSHWHNNIFKGHVSKDISIKADRKKVTCTGKSGSVCLMHTRLLHASSPNISSLPRTLYIMVFSATHSIPLSPSPVPTENQGILLRGNNENKIKTMTFEMEMPELPYGASFFDQQNKN
tara:strand:- start:2589 stop:3443 length:855 start_codon:yes stop_codon:yes gene_type:complete